MNQAVITGTKERTRSQPKSKVQSNFKNNNETKIFVLLMLPGLVYFIIFKYGPMYGILLAFKDFNPIDGITGSPWAGLKHFKPIFEQASIKASHLQYATDQCIENCNRISFSNLIRAYAQ